ncbi:phosphoethanolamine--lipid A transferase [Variovorax sp. J22G21]|uniref:phosphoethanolamine transferase n=1 Tax=Variovorax fucosicus TaxID=3053517 RepID=UPI0025749163|nr:MULTISPECIES: phosphoethanolamine--lipid A transferase [unclassified Variovorax]MDM0038960.1 phosphoethanolamine--lipid A transferase [Variovorax sp. J22R193]MDM0063736.1 phosphoethanolamine--lipid A transferase [Variovorax sp. J22G21]
MSPSDLETAPVHHVHQVEAPAQNYSPAALWVRFSQGLARPRPAWQVVLWLSLYLLLTTNWPLGNELARIGGAPSAYMPTTIAVGLLALCGSVAFLSLTAWSRWLKPLWFAVVVLAAVVQHYMLAYRVVMDPTMIANALQTDAKEARDLLSWRMAFNVGVVVVPAAMLLWRVRIIRMRFFSNLWRNAALLLLAVVVALGTAVAMNRQLAPLMRNNVHLRYMMNPIASLYSTGAVFIKPLFKRSGKLIPITAGTTLGASYAAQARPPMFVVVVGETARADHFALNGYARDTTPELAKRGVLSYRDVHSCGTNTLVSVPCMFSPLGKQGYESRKDDYENLVDVLQAAGLAVLWLDNQAGCKGVCTRIPNASAFEGLDAATKKALCDGDECLDNVMLNGLDVRIAALPAERRAKGVVLVMHQMGSHGPAYYKRSAPDVKRFQPECKTNALAECGHNELINAYDNSIVQTDRFLADTIDWLKAQSKAYDPAMLYVSDHGESLGEYGLFLHGVPYSFAPEAQKHVPMVTWFSEGMSKRRKLSRSCMEARLDTPLTHDNLYHTVLGLMDVITPTYRPALDALGACRNTG